MIKICRSYLSTKRQVSSFLSLREFQEWKDKVRRLLVHSGDGSKAHQCLSLTNICHTHEATKAGLPLLRESEVFHPEIFNSQKPREMFFCKFLQAMIENAQLVIF